MKALVLRSPGSLVMEAWPVPGPEAGELLVRTRAATICTSDLNDINHNPFGITLPMVMGHEGAGEVVQVGEGVAGFAPGDRVTAHPAMPCSRCDACARGLDWLCDDLTHLGLNMWGVFAEYFCIRADRARKIPAGLDYAAATLMEPVCVCIEGIERAVVKPGGNVLILGDGPFGVIMARLLPAWQPARVVLVGRHPFRIAQARNVTALNEHESGDILADIHKATGGRGIDSAILCAGTQQAVDTCIAALRAGGTLSVFSAVPGAPGVDLFKVHVKELNICGACNDPNYLDRALAMLADPAMDIPGVITHRLPFGQWERAFQLAEKGKDEALKVTLLFDEEAPA